MVRFYVVNRYYSHAGGAAVNSNGKPDEKQGNVRETVQEDEKIMSDHLDTTNTDQKQEDENRYEKVCAMCRRTESKAGKMIELPGGLNVCVDCMQKAFDTMNNGEKGEAGEGDGHRLHTGSP